MKKRILFLFLFGTIFSNFNIATAQVDTFYVATTGSDSNSGTEASPWKSITKAVNVLKEGQTVLIHGGTYHEKIKMARSGAADRFITIMAYPNEKPVVDGSGSGTIFDLNGKSYLKIQGLHLQNGFDGFSCSSASSHIKLENNEIFNTQSCGIQLKYCSEALVKGNLTDNVCSSSWGECITFTQCEYIDIAYNEVRNSLTSSAGGEGIDVKASKHMRVYGNVVHDMLKLGIYLDAYDGLNYDVEVFNNTVYKCANGIIISSELQNAWEKVRIYNNIIYDCKYDGIGIVNWPRAAGSEGFPIKDVIIENNLIYETTVNTGISALAIDAGQGSDFIIRNNIFYNFSSVFYTPKKPANLLITNNLSNKGSAANLYSNAIIADPQFVNATLKDFHLKNSSPAINKGAVTSILFDKDMMNRTAGEACDIGPYENQQTPSSFVLPELAKPAFTPVSLSVKQSDDDGYEDISTGIVNLQSAGVEISYVSSTTRSIAALRFTNMNIPQGAKITNSSLNLTINKSTGSFGIDVIKISAEKSDNSQPLTTETNNISKRSKTANVAYWLPQSATAGNKKITPQLDYLINEVISGPNWVSGNSITFFFEFETSHALYFNSYETGNNTSAKLNIEYTNDLNSGVQSMKKYDAVRIYPNPVLDELFFSEEVSNISITNLTGQKIEEFTNTGYRKINAHKLKSGIYFVSYTDLRGNTTTDKIIKN